MGGVEDDRRLVIQDYFHEERDWHLDEAMDALAELDTEDLLDLKTVAAMLHLPGGAPTSTPALQPRGYRLLSKIPRLPERHRAHRRALRQPAEDHAGHHRRPRRRRGRRRDPGPGHQGRPGPPGRDAASSTATADSLTAGGRRGVAPPTAVTSHVAGRNPCASRCRPARRELASPTAPVGAWCSPPTSVGLRPLFDDLCARLAAEHGWAVCAPEPFPGRESMTLEERIGRGRRARRRRAASATLVAAADAPRGSASSRSPCSGSAWAACTR